MRRDTVVVACGVAATLTAGGALTTIGPWYERLRKPSFQPPGWAFGPAWTTIGILTAVGVIGAWRSAGDDPGRKRRVLALTAANAFLNALWSALFFARRRPDWALAEVVSLWSSIAAMILFLPRPKDHDLARARSTRFLLPYLAWVTFAAVLNAEIVRLNRPFGREPGKTGRG